MVQPLDPLDSSTASTMFVRVLGEVVGRAGVGIEDFARATGIPPARANDPNDRITLRELCKLLESALELTRDEALGLHLAEQTNESAFGLLAHIVMHAPTLREMVAVASQFRTIILDRGPLVLVESGDEALLRYDFVRGTPRADRMFADFCVLGLLRVIRQYLGADALPRQVYFQHARPAYHHEYARIFGGRASFGHDFIGLAIDRDAIDKRQIHQHAKLYSMLRSEAEQVAERSIHGSSYTDRVLAHLQSRPPSALPDVNVAARDLGVSPRTLSRRLVEEGSSFRELRQRAMENAATQMLGDASRSMKDVAHHMGFSDVTAFFRAFKRWKGTTPQEYRDTLRTR